MSPCSYEDQSSLSQEPEGSGEGFGQVLFDLKPFKKNFGKQMSVELQKSANMKSEVSKSSEEN